VLQQDQIKLKKNAIIFNLVTVTMVSRPHSYLRIFCH